MHAAIRDSGVENQQIWSVSRQALAPSLLNSFTFNSGDGTKIIRSIIRSLIIFIALPSNVQFQPYSHEKYSAARRLSLKYSIAVRLARNSVFSGVANTNA